MQTVKVTRIREGTYKRSVEQVPVAWILACPKRRISPDHYRQDGTCLCQAACLCDVLMPEHRPCASCRRER